MTDRLTWTCAFKKIFSPEKCYTRIKIFSDCVKNFCPALKIFVHLVRSCLEVFSSTFSVLLVHVNVFIIRRMILSDVLVKELMQGR